MAGRLSKAGWLVIVGVLQSCAVTHSTYDHESLAFLPLKGATAFSHYAPVVVTNGSKTSYDRIGRPRVVVNGEGETVVEVDAADPTYFVDQRGFVTNQGRYTNLIYRFHFEKVPYSLIPFNLTAGKNVGLIIVVTLNEHNKPVLVTTVHSCGCYLAIIPTSFLTKSAYPEGWQSGVVQTVYGERLPRVLDYPARFSIADRLVVYLREETHRVTDVRVEPAEDIVQKYVPVNVALEGISQLQNLKAPDGKTTSFFEEKGPRKGYVKGAKKPLEMLLMSWWTLDLYVGNDKAYGDVDITGARFYTSLKPWSREASDMWDFPRFLKYWGWQL